MTAPRPSIRFNFANTPWYLDSRINFQRNSIATYVNETGYIASVPANSPRWTFDPLTGECLGVVIENERTNTFLYSEDFSNAAWTKSNCVASANTAIAPDGATTGGTITASTTNGFVSQGVTLTSAGNALACSIFAKANASNFLRIRIVGGSDTVDCWFNLATKEVGSNTVGSATCAFAYKQVDIFPNDWVRCTLGVTTASATSFTAAFAPAASDSTSPAAANSIFVWGAQAEQATSGFGTTSYIPTTASTVVRNADNFYMPVAPTTDRWFNTVEGTLYFEWVFRGLSNSGSVVFGGIGDTFSNTVYMSKGSTTFTGTVLTGGAGVTPGKTYSPVVGTRTKAALSWGSALVEMTLDGQSTTVASVTAPAPASTVRMAVGCAPWGASSITTCAMSNMRAFAYYPQKLSAAEMMEITTP
jgi:hypothetical protein